MIAEHQTLMNEVFREAIKRTVASGDLRPITVVVEAISKIFAEGTTADVREILPLVQTVLEQARSGPPTTMLSGPKKKEFLAGAMWALTVAGDARLIKDENEH